MATVPLIVVVGPTASGKTALAIELAEIFDGEIICADSRTVYRGLDIGTAKPTAEEQTRVPHHLLDVVRPDEPFTVADFKHLANETIADISSRGKLPIMVGGSGLYVDSVLFDYSFSKASAARNPENLRHVAKGSSGNRAGIRENTLVIGLKVDHDKRRASISARVDQMISDGFLDEVAGLRRDHPGSKALDAPGYKAFSKYLEGEVSLDEAKALFVRNDLRLAKRQMTWFRRNNSIHWVNNREKVVDLATTFLSKKSD